MKSLYEISTDLMTLFNEIDNAGGEITESQEALMAIGRSELNQKGVSYAYIIKTFEGEVEIAKAEIKRIQQLIKIREGIVSKLKETLKNALLTFEIDEIKTELVKINFRASKSVNIFDENLLPNDCVIIEKKPISKTELKKRIEAGEYIPGCEIVENLNLQIK